VFRGSASVSFVETAIELQQVMLRSATPASMFSEVRR